MATNYLRPSRTDNILGARTEVLESLAVPVSYEVRTEQGSRTILTLEAARSEADTSALEFMLDDAVSSDPEQNYDIAKYGTRQSAGIFQNSFDHSLGTFEAITDLRGPGSYEPLSIASPTPENSFDGLSESAKATISNSIDLEDYQEIYDRSIRGQELEREMLEKSNPDRLKKIENSIRAEKLGDTNSNQTAMFKKYFTGRGTDYFLMISTGAAEKVQVLLTQAAVRKHAKPGVTSLTIKVEHTKERNQRNPVKLINNTAKVPTRKAMQLAILAEQARQARKEGNN